MLEHTTHPSLLAERATVALVGAGGNGSQMLSGLARLDSAIRALGHQGLDVALFDPDHVSEANLGRQLFSRADVGRNKAAVLITRTNAWFGLQWKACEFTFGERGTANTGGGPQIVISCVDSARSRLTIGKRLRAAYRKPLYWMDLGNRAADGQVVLGIPAWNAKHAAFEYRLPTVLELYPELHTAQKRLDRQNGPSCSLAQALERQELFVNQAVVTPALQLLWQIFRYGRTSWCGAFVNLSTGRTAPLPIDPKAWARLGYRRPSPPKERKRADGHQAR